MLVVSLAGSPGARSRSSVLLGEARQWLNAHGVEVASWRIQDFPPEDLIQARFESPQVKAFVEHVHNADGLVVSTPIYKASFSGVLKTVLDLLPERALNHKVVLPLATGGSIAHMLAVDYALKPVLAALKAQEILPGVFADDSQVSYESETPLSPALAERLDESLELFLAALARRPKPVEPHVLTAQLTQARWSI